ncbi:Lipin/Ned1/Smp2-domain-containing protein [Pilaira anomala]|nr:Lipin/Ned1/Smp2-domain-containing protein [Pilaira anomala]
MEYVGKLGSLFTSVHNFYNEINPATLSGAIDIVVVEQQDGELACSPFHVRFGKLSVLMPQEKRVQIKVNGEVVPYVMKVGEAGEAFFVFETEHEVPEEFQTSPIMEAVSEKSEEDPPYLDIGESKDTTKDGEPTDSFEDEPKHNHTTLSSFPAELQSPKMIIEEQMDKVVTKMDPYQPEQQEEKEQEPKPMPKNDLYPLDDGSSLIERVIPEAITTTTVAKERFIVRPALGDIYSTWMDVTHTSVHNSDDSHPLDATTTDHHSTNETGHGKGDESIVLDIAGYKTGRPEDEEEEEESWSHEKEEAAKLVKKEIVDNLFLNNKSKDLSSKSSPLIPEDIAKETLKEAVVPTKEEDVPEQDVSNEVETKEDGSKQDVSNEVETKEDGSNEDVSKEDVSNEVETKDETHQVDPVTIAENEGSDAKEALKDKTVPEKQDQAAASVMTPPKRSLWGWGSARRQATNESLEPATPPVAPDKEVSAVSTEEPNNKSFENMPGTSYRIEMSLCGDSVFGKDEEENARVFNEHITTYDNFTHNPNMLNDKRLVFRYEGRYFAAGHTGPLFTSLFLFKKPIEEKDVKQDVSDSRESYQFGKGWRQWLSRSSVAAPNTETTTATTTTNQDSAAAAATAAADKQPTTEKERVDTPGQSEASSQQVGQDITTFTTTTTTTSVGWSADHVHPGQEQEDAFPRAPRKVYAKTLRLTSDQLKSLNLNKGANTISFSVSSAYQGTATCAAKIFYWNYGYSVVISDIDGTITKSDALGHVFTMIGKDWTHMGVAKLYTDIANNGYHFLYLTSRAIGQADYTRDYLKKVAQDKYQLPDGPVIMSPDRLFTSFHREVIIRKPEVFKMACLRDVQRLFGGRDPFYAGFGNRITDARSYRSVNVPTSRIFTIDPYGDLKLELLMGFKSSYIHLNDLVDQIFPPINRVIDEEFTDWNYWKSPFPEIEIPELDIPLEPTSPKPKPIRPDPSVLPSSSVVASTSNQRGLLRSFTSRSDSSQSKPQSSSSMTTTTVFKSPKFTSVDSSSSSSTTNKKEVANENEVTGDQKASAAITNTEKDDVSIVSTSPTDSVGGSLMNKVSSGFGGVRSTLSRTFLSSSESGTSTPTTPTATEEKVVAIKKQEEEEDEEDEDIKNNIQDVDSLLDDIDMDEIPFI